MNEANPCKQFDEGLAVKRRTVGVSIVKMKHLWFLLFQRTSHGQSMFRGSLYKANFQALPDFFFA